MSQINPTVSEILNNSTGVIGKHLCKSYLNLAKGDFFKKHNRKANLDDAQELRNLYEVRWIDYYIHRPERARIEREISQPIWDFGCSLKIDVSTSMCYFLIDRLGYDFTKNYPEIKEYNYGTYIINNGLFEDYKAYVSTNISKIPRYRKREYIDFGHLAYNGVTNDF